jgi:5'-nucleotidase
MRVARLLLALWLLLYAAAVPALDILLTNDDGFDSANLRALYQRLKAAGHDVIIVAPAFNQSSTGGKVEYQRAIGPLQRDTRDGRISAGAPGIGVDPQDDDIHYIDATPVMSLLYGLDVVAARHWKHPPQLVISGPNEGPNDGPAIISSGTVSAALYAINRGLPAIAVSDAPWDKLSWTTLEPDSRAWAVADVVVRLVDALERGRRDRHPLLPAGAGLNVNIPELPAAALASARFVFSHLGGISLYTPVFFGQLDESAVAARLGRASKQPGLSSVEAGQPAPDGVALPSDDDPRAEARLATRAITVSVMQGVPEGRASQRRAVRRQLSALLDQGPLTPK